METTCTRTDVRMRRVSQLVIAGTALMLGAGAFWSMVRTEHMSRPSVLGLITLLLLVSTYGFLISPRALVKKRPWRDQGRRILWCIGLVCLPLSVSGWLLATVFS